MSGQAQISGGKNSQATCNLLSKRVARVCVRVFMDLHGDSANKHQGCVLEETRKGLKTQHSRGDITLMSCAGRAGVG